MEQRLYGSQIAIGKRHQPLVRPKTALCPELRSGDIHEDKAAAGREQIVEVPQRRPHVADGM